MGSITTRTEASVNSRPARAVGLVVLGALSITPFTATAQQARPSSPQPISAERSTRNPATLRDDRYDRRAEARQGFVPSIETSVTYVDNVLLGEAEKTSSIITQLIPGFTYDVARGRLAASADYSMQGIAYSDDSERNQAYHRFDGIARGEVVSDLFYILGRASAGQQLVNPTATGGSLENILDTGGNVVNAYMASITPYVTKDIGGTTFDARYTRGFVHYDDVETTTDTAPAPGLLIPISNSQNEEIYAGWGTQEMNPSRFSWQLSYDRQKADYDTAPTFTYELALLELGFRITRTFTLLANGGKESDATDIAGAAELDSTYYEGGFQWQLARDHQVRALAGHRFYGNSYNFLYRFTGRRVTFWTTYSEGPTTSSQELFLRPISDAGAIPSSTVTGIGGVSSDVFVRKYLDVRGTLEGRLTTIGIEGGYFRRIYVNLAERNERTVQGGITVTRRLGPRSSLRASYGYRDIEAVNLLLGASRDTNLRLEYLRTIGKDFTVGVAAGRNSVTASTAEYDVNYGLVRLSKIF